MAWFNKKNKNQYKDAILADKKHEAENEETVKEKQALNKSVTVHLQSKKKFEEDRISFYKTLSKIGFSVGAVGAVIGLAGVIAVAALAPLKKSEPFVLRVDNNTGFTDIVQPISNSQATTYGEVLDKYWLARYVIERESYDWQTIQTSFDTIKLMSASPVFSEYNTYITSLESPVKLFEEEKKIKTTILSVAFIGGVGQVRFTKTVLNANGTPDSSYPVTYWLATVAYDYTHEIKLENERRMNPLGFNVTSYRVDSENIK